MPHHPIQLLLVEGNPAEAERLDSLLGCLPDLPCSVDRFSDISFAEAYLQSHRPSVLLLSLETARTGSDELVFGLRQRYPWLPIIVVATDHNLEAAETLIRCGVQECVGQDELLPDLIGRAVRHALARHAAESSLRANQDLIQLVAENTTDLIAVLDREGRRLYNNPSYARTFGTAAELAGTDSFAEVHPEDRDHIRQLFHQTLESGQGKRAEFRLLLPGGTVRCLESVGSVILDAQGQPDRVVVVSRDMTEKQELLGGLDRALSELRALHQQLQNNQRRLLEAEKLEAVSTFAGAIAHEVKNTLQTLLLGLDFLKAGSAVADAGAAGVLEEMETATRKADSAMRNLLDLSGTGTTEAVEQDLNVLVTQCADAVLPEADARRVRLDRRLASRLPRTAVQVVQVRHVLLRALLDAIQITGPGGQVRISTSVRGATASSATDSSGRPTTVVIEIEDDGPRRVETNPGLAPGRGAAGGPGRPMLDLPILRKVVEGFGARVEVANREPRGSKIVLMFKMATPAAVDRNAISDPSPP